jgi:NhaA family Na+:H+ antiporter
MRNSEGTTAPLVTLERALQPWVLLLILPIFAFANAGLSMANVVSSELADLVPLGVAAGLFFGKQIGVFLFAYIAIKLGFAARPANASWVQLYGVAILCGIGFTMSLFMGLLAYSSSPTLQEEAKLGVLVGSLLSALYGIFVLRLARQ